MNSSIAVSGQLRAMRMMLVALFAIASVACRDAPAQGPARQSPNPRPIDGGIAVETVATGLVHPWGLEILPDGRLLVTEREGRLRVIDRNGRVSDPVAGLPDISERGQGGLLDVALDPGFARNRLIYLSFTEAGDAGTSGVAVLRTRLGEGRLDSVRVIYRQHPKVAGGSHFGSRLVFRADGTLFVTQGDRNARSHVQNLSSGIGKIMRINTDGSVPRDNPFVNRPGALPEIWSYGHRNVQSAALHPETGQLWTVEHGSRGGDELNHPESGKNYGWPVISYGREYSGGTIGEGTTKAGMEQPVYYWDPVIAPSGMTFYTGALFPGWRGSILVGGLVSNRLVRLTLSNGGVSGEEAYLGDLDERIRDVKQAPDGSVLVITDSSRGRVLRLRPRGR